jgi:hypothetical protein
MATEKDSLEARVLTWLSGHGFPLEMRVAEVFQKHSARLIQSEYFPDPVTGEAREVDLVAHWQERFDQTVVRLTFVVECKSSKDKPWVLFASPTKLSRKACVSQRAATKLGRYFLREAADDAEVQRLAVFELPSQTAYGGKPAFTEPGKPDAFFAAISSVCAAAAAESDYDDQQSRLNYCEIVFPLVVVDSNLFTARLSETGDMELKLQKSAVLVWRNPVLSMPNTIVDIVSAEHVEEFVAGRASAVRDLLGMCQAGLQPKLANALARRELHRAVKRAPKIPAVDGK